MAYVRVEDINDLEALLIEEVHGRGRWVAVWFIKMDFDDDGFDEIKKPCRTFQNSQFVSFGIDLQQAWREDGTPLDALVEAHYGGRHGGGFAAHRVER